jgi:hypothetical protein
MIDDGLGCAADIFAEVKSIAGGATSVVGSFGRAAAPDGNKCIDGLARNLDLKPGFPTYPPGPEACNGDPSGFPPGGDAVLVNEVFPFEIARERFAYYLCELKNGRLRSVLIHLAEGSATDASARREFRMLKAQNLLVEGVVIIHGAALTLSDFNDMREKNVGLIWSPRSNNELYGATANIPAALQAGVSIALAPDWSPTGSAGVLQEMNYVAANYGFIPPGRIVDMATSVPAKLARIDDKIGRLEKGLYADLVVVRSGRASPYEAVTSATPADIQLVMVGGRPIYGDYDLMAQILPSTDLVQLTVCGVSKAVNFSGRSQPWTEVRAKLDAALQRYGTALSSIECD